MHVDVNKGVSPAQGLPTKIGQRERCSSSPRSPQFPLCESVTVFIPTQRRELAAAFELVYRTFVRRGLIRPHSGEILYRPTYGLDANRTIVATDITGECAGTLSVVGDNVFGLQAEATYPDEVDDLRRKGRRLAEVTGLAIDSTSCVPRLGIFYALTRFMFQYSCWRGYDDLLLLLHPRHVSLYERFFRVERLGPCRRHHLVSDNPAIACRIDLHEVEQLVHPDLLLQYTGGKIPRESFLQPPIARADHEYFCARMSIGSPRRRPVAALARQNASYS